MYKIVDTAIYSIPKHTTSVANNLPPHRVISDSVNDVVSYCHTTGYPSPLVSGSFVEKSTFTGAQATVFDTLCRAISTSKQMSYSTAKISDNCNSNKELVTIQK